MLAESSDLLGLPWRGVPVAPDTIGMTFANATEDACAGTNPRHCAPTEVHVWRIALDCGSGSFSILESLLSRDERHRADRFRFEALRRRWIVAHGALRVILARYSGAAPERLEFDLGPYGKPELAGRRERLAFNLSHSGDLALVAVTGARCVGIDIEVVRHDLDHEALTRQFFANGEAEHIQALAPAARIAAFFACWTRKEAFIKAIGGGLSIELKSFQVTVQPDAPARLLRMDGDLDAPHRWYLEDLSEPGAAAALAVPEPAARVQQFRFGAPGR
jgi:4'-phosphopantetheinyl transferase